MNMLDFVTICYDREGPMLELQYRSIARFVAPEAIGRIILVWNTPEPGAALRARIAPPLCAALGPLADRLDIHARAEVSDDPDLAAADGWLSQQVLKLKVAERCPSPHYCILDGKNHFIRTVTTEDFFTGGRPKSYAFDYSNGGAFLRRLKVGMGYFGITDAGLICRALPSVTPYVMHRALVLEMLAAIEAGEGKSFPQCFLHEPFRGKATEFLLYCAFIAGKGALDELYSLGERQAVTFFSHAPSTVRGFNAEMSRLKQPSTLTLGIHRGRFQNLAPEHREAIVALWLKRGLFASSAEAEGFIAYYQP